MRSSGPHSDDERPAVDARLVMPEQRYEVIDGEVQYVPPADERHGTRHARVTSLVQAHLDDAFDIAIDMLTRTSKLNDIAPDVSVFPRACDPQTGGRQLEHLAFEVVSEQSLDNAGKKAARLTERGVRRVFGIDVGRGRLLEWSTATSNWQMLKHRGEITDSAFAVPVPIEALVHAVKCDDAIARALLKRGNPVLTAAVDAGRKEGVADTLLTVLEVRAIAVDAAAERRIRSANRDELARWVRRAPTCPDIDSLFADD